MKHTTKSYLVLFLIVFVAVSCGPVTAVPTATKIIPTTTIVPPTNTSLPVPSPTATLSQLEKEFAIPTRQDDYLGTPTPIAIPALSSAGMKLRELSEQNYLGLIYEMNRYSYQGYPSYGDWWTDGEFVSSQEAVAVAIQEYLYRFPQSPNVDRLRWQLAFIDSIISLPGNEYSDHWVVNELQKSLNQSNVLPDKLESVLDKYWFDVAYFQPIENLFGDGTTAWFYVINPQVWDDQENDLKSSDYFPRGGLFIVVREIDSSKFEIYLLENDWNFLNSSSSLFEISDHNNNGIPEIALNLWLHSGTMCAGNFKIFEWKDTSFVDLTKGQITIGDCSDQYEYSFVDGKPAIIFDEFFEPVPSLYTWDGNYYEFAGYRSSNLLEKWWSARSLAEEAEAIEALLSSEDTEGLSFSQIDFLRFRLGIVYALNSDTLQAKKVLQDLVDHRRDETRIVYSDFAKNFLRYYSDGKSLFQACRKSREIFNSVTDSSESDDNLFGIPFDFTFGPGLLRCFDRDVFEPLITRIPITIENVSAELRKHGMNLYYAEKRDVNLDGITEEWLIIFDDGIHVIVPDGSHYKAAQLEYFWYGEDLTQYSNVEINIERWMNIQDPVMTVVTDQDLSILNIDDDYASTELGYDFVVNEIFFSSQDTPPSYQVFFMKPQPGEEYYGVPWSGYRWDIEHEKFRDDLIEYRLFVQHNSEEVVKLAEQILPLLEEWGNISDARWWIPYNYYIVGLSYELSGDQERAAQIYWQLWHNYPDSHYARLAELKLEPIGPQ